MLKKILCTITAVIISAVSLTSCASDSSSSSSGATSNSDNGSSVTSAGLTEEQAKSATVDVKLTVDGTEVDTSDLVFCTVNGVDIPFDYYRFYWLSYLSTYLENGVDMTLQENIDALKTSVETEIISTYGLIALGADNGMSISAESEELANESYLSLIGSFDSVDTYAEALAESFMTDSVLRTYYYNQYAYYDIGSALFSEDSPFAKTKEDFLTAVDNGEYCRTLNLLVSYASGAELSDEDKEAWDELTISERSKKYDTAYNLLTDAEKETAKAKAKATAEEVLKRANDGEDFYQLMAEYNLDPGMTPADNNDITSIDGYYITKEHSFVQEYIDGAFALKDNEISGLVETTYGYHIIKRLPIDMDYINSNADDLAEDYSTSLINKAINDYYDNVKVEYCEYYDKLTKDSIS